MRVVRRFGGKVTVRAAIAAVPREWFVPDTIWVVRETGQCSGWTALRRHDDPDGWLAEVRSGDAIATQIDDGADGGTWPTSSCSQIGIVTRMLELADLRPGLRVLEIGTGTGWNAALLAHICGQENVTTVEVDAGLAEQARRRLTGAGYDGVAVMVDDGEGGHSPGAPFDRVIATAAVTRLPYAWVEQTRPGGLILAPWAPTVHPTGPLALLAVDEDGRADGRFVCPSSFMPLREHRYTEPDRQDYQRRWEQTGRPSLERFGIAVTREGQRIWIDSPENPVE